MFEKFVCKISLLLSQAQKTQELFILHAQELSEFLYSITLEYIEELHASIWLSKVLLLSLFDNT